MSSCYVPNCDKAAEEAGEKGRLIFKAPSTGVYKWLKFLPKRATSFNPRTEGVCLKHFEDRYIQKEEVVSICGDREVFKLDPWILTPDAVPTIFPQSDTTTDTMNPTSVHSDAASGNDDFQPSQNDDDDSSSLPFDDLIRFDSLNGTNIKEEADDDAAGAKRKSVPSSRPGPLSKKLKSEAESILPDDGEEFGETKLFDTPSGRPAHLKREIIAPSRIRESMTAESPPYDMDDNYMDVPSPPESPPSPRGGRGRGGGRGGKRGRPRGSGSARGRKTPAGRETLKIKLATTYPAKIIQTPVTPSNQRREGGCFIEYCNHNPNATLFRMPQQTKAKLKDWLRYIPVAALANVPFDPRIHVLCEDHFDKKFVMNTPKGKILTGDAIPSIFSNYPKQAFSGKKERAVPVPKPRKPKMGPKSRVEVVDGYEIEYDSDPDYAPEPITVTIDDDDDEPGATAAKKPPPTPAVRKYAPASATKPGGKPAGKILEITDAGYTLQYIYTMKERIQLPQAEFWMFRLLVDKETKVRCIFIAEVVSRLERLLFRRSIKIRQDLTFRVEANGIDFTQMFNETGHKVESLYKLQEMILDLSAFKVCEGWAQFETVEPSPIGRKIQGIWFANNCEGLNLNSSRCRACVALKTALTARKSGLSLNSTDPAVVQQIRKLPKDDALHLQLQIQDHLREKTKLKYELSVVEKRESRLQDKIRMLEAGMKVKGKTVYVTSATPTPATVGSTPQAPSASNSVVVSPGKPPTAVASTITYAPRTRMVRPRATTTSTTFSVTSRPATAPTASSLMRKQTPIIVTPTPLYPLGVPNNMTPRLGHPLQPHYQPSILTPTFVLAQGSGTEIGHQAIDTTQQLLPSLNLGSATLPGVNVTLQKAGGQDGSSEEITLLSL